MKPDGILRDQTIGDQFIDNEYQALLILLAKWEKQKGCNSDELWSYFLPFFENFGNLLKKVEIDMIKNNYAHSEQFYKSSKSALSYLKTLYQLQSDDLLIECRQVLSKTIIHACIYYKKFKGVNINRKSPPLMLIK